MPSSQYEPKKKTIGEILSVTTPRLVVPDYQRNFSWTSTEVEELWADLWAFSQRYPGDTINEETYFLGSSVLVDGTTHLAVLDGQQRLATATILLAVISEYLAHYSADASLRIRHRYVADFDDASGETTFKLTLNVYDRDFFRATFQDVPPTPVEPSRLSHRLMIEARDFFRNEFEEKYSSLAPRDAFQWSLRIQNVLCNHATVIAVTSSDEDNASNVFETLNDRGIGLSTPDLVRNLLLRRAPESDREEIVQAWGEASELEPSGTIDDLLRFYWITRVGDIKSRTLFREVKSRVVDDHLSSLVLSRELKASADSYRAILEARDDEPGFASALAAARQLGARALYPVFLSIQARGDDEKRIDLARSLIVLFVRHTLIGGLSNTRLESFVYELAQQIREGKSFSDCIQEISLWAPQNENFRRQFTTASVSRTASARYLLTEIEEGLRRTRELDVGPPARVHVEHIYPQTPTTRWLNHDEQINRLGNLTLLAKPLNEAIRNSDFALKKENAYQRSELVLTQELCSCHSWDDVQIANRQSRLAEIALQIWLFPAP